MHHERATPEVDSKRPESLDARLLADVDEAFEHAADRANAALLEVPPEADLEVRFVTGLAAVLDVAAAHPDRARLCLLEAPGLGAAAVATREAGLQRFVDLLDRELAPNGAAPPPLMSEMVVGGVYEVMQRAVRAGDPGGLPDLAGELGRLWLPALRGR